jgi:hypothetical protein
MTIAYIGFCNNLWKTIKKFGEALSKLSRVIIIKKISEVSKAKAYEKLSQENS